MSDRGHEYERYAAECRSLAAQMKGPEQRATMLRLAATWEKLAREGQRRPSPSEKLAETPSLAEKNGSGPSAEHRKQQA